jgi:endonuclease-3 related protein
MTRRRAPLNAWYEALERAWGPQGWWPGRTRFEVVAGAVLTQAVAWTNVEKAIGRMRRERLLSVAALRAAGGAAIERAIRPAGYHTRKARTLLAFVGHVADRHAGRLDRFLRQPTQPLRAELLALPGIGPETADAILLYAARRPVFVIDAYTRRILARHGAARADEPYAALQRRFEVALPSNTRVFNQFHALLVRAGKEHCRKTAPRCDDCPLRPWLPPGGPRDPEDPDPSVRIRRAPHPARRHRRAD